MLIVPTIVNIRNLSSVDLNYFVGVAISLVVFLLLWFLVLRRSANEL